MRVLGFAAGLAALQALDAFGCATCYGASDSPLAAGMNWGIVTLLGFIGMMLAGVAAFFVYLGRRASAFAGSPVSAPRPREGGSTTQPNQN